MAPALGARGEGALAIPHDPGRGIIVVMTVPHVTLPLQAMRRLLAIATTLVLSAGCTQGFPEATTGSGAIVAGGSGSSAIVGTYTLSTANGQSLPYTYQTTTGGDKYEILSATFTLSSNGTWSSQTNERQTIGGVVTTPTYPDAGNYTVSGGTASFASTVPGGDPSFQGTLGGSTLTITASFSSGSSVVLVYKK